MIVMVDVRVFFCFLSLAGFFLEEKDGERCGRNWRGLQTEIFFYFFFLILGVGMGE
jgi:hypothetical protein